MRIVDSDAFLDMPLSSQALYFHLNMRADDDGFVNNPKRIQRTIGASEDDLKLLIVKRFLICFENGVIVIKHWRMHNTLRKDRYIPTHYQEEFDTLCVKDNNAYTEKPENKGNSESGNQMATTWQPNGNHLATQSSIVESSIEENRVVESSVVAQNGPHNPTPTTAGLNSDYNNLIKKFGKEFVDERVERAKMYKNTTIDTVAKWCEEDFKKKKNKAAGKNSFNSFPQREYDDKTYKELERELLLKD